MAKGIVKANSYKVFLDKVEAKPKPSKAERRVAVAKDVIYRLKRNLQKGYLGYGNGKAELPKRVTLEDSVQPYINKVQKQCNACALGSCFLSYIRLENNVKFKDIAMFKIEDGILDIYIERYDIEKSLKTIFSEKQMSLIESAFEKSYTFGNGLVNMDQAVSFGEGFDINKGRIIAIMENIVENKGTFKP